VRFWGAARRLLYTRRVSGKRTVWLVGMMGAGKSTVGPELAERLGLPYVDTDAEVARAADRTVAEVFQQEGEASFRSRERSEIEAWAGERAVVALGGGAMAQPGVPELLEGSGTVVYLRARPETLLSRLGHCLDRPLLRDLAPAQREARLAALLGERGAAYECADIVVDTDAGGIPEVVESVVRRLENGADS
jgi:shikimate kinase